MFTVGAFKYENINEAAPVATPPAMLRVTHWQTATKAPIWSNLVEGAKIYGGQAAELNFEVNIKGEII